MANYATNIFYASTENEKDLDKVENFLEDTFYDCYLDRSEDKIYIRVLTHELCNEYVNFQVFSNGEWSYR